MERNAIKDSEIDQYLHQLETHTLKSIEITPLFLNESMTLGVSTSTVTYDIPIDYFYE